METRIAREPSDTVSELAGDAEESVDALSEAREAINLRLLLELRRRLKGTAEKEIAIGAERIRHLRSELRSAEAEMRLCARALEGRSQALARLTARLDDASSRASQTCARLSALEQEHVDLSHQLGLAQRAAAGLRESVRAARHVRNGTLDSFVLATMALVNDLAYAVRDQSSLQVRGRDLIDESETFAARAALLRDCFSSTQSAIASVCENIARALDGRRGGAAAPQESGEGEEPQNR